MDPLLWQPSAERIAQTNMSAFRRQVETNFQVELPDYPALYRWSVEQPERFWRTLWDFAEIVGELTP